MKKTAIIASLLLSSTLLVACNDQESKKVSKDDSGAELKIAVVGNFPDIKKDLQIDSIELGDLKGNLKKYDAVFISKKFLQAASEKEYADVYKKADVPFFFIESKKSYQPFVDPEMSYNDEIETGSNSYITGVYYGKGPERSWEYGINDPNPTSEEKEIIFNSVFETIKTVDHPFSDESVSS